MSDTTNIEWCDSTFNPWIGCTRVSPACDDCYAALSTPARTMAVAWGAGEPRRRTGAANWAEPLRWERQAAEFQAAHGRRRRVFCASLADVFDNEVDPAWRADLFDLIERTPSLDWLLLTKRIGNAHRMIGEALITLGVRPGGAGPTSLLPSWPWPNVWIGATVVNQTEADRDIPKLLSTPAAVRFLSMEPLLGEVSLRWLAAWPENAPTVAQKPGPVTDHLDGLRRLDWVIAGGESGPKARPAHPGWYRLLRDQCEAAGVPFLFKQWGEWLGEMQDGNPNVSQQEINCTDSAVRVGKKLAGRLLDGIEHSGYPRGFA